MPSTTRTRQNRSHSQARQGPRRLLKKTRQTFYRNEGLVQDCFVGSNGWRCQRASRERPGSSGPWNDCFDLYQHDSDGWHLSLMVHNVPVRRRQVLDLSSEFSERQHSKTSSLLDSNS
jgi:hypothetical protein